MSKKILGKLLPESVWLQVITLQCGLRGLDRQGEAVLVSIVSELLRDLRPCTDRIDAPLLTIRSLVLNRKGPCSYTSSLRSVQPMIAQ